jgi:accessory colonization factor AcfC
MNIAIRKNAGAKTSEFAAWLRSDETAPAFKKLG